MMRPICVENEYENEGLVPPGPRTAWKLSLQVLIPDP